MLDLERVAELRDEIGAEDMADVMEMFLQEVSGKLDSLSTSQTLKEDLHFIKSSSLNIGFKSLAELSGELELACQQAGNAVEVSALSDCFQASCAALSGAALY